jgi:hypothetical protein
MRQMIQKICEDAENRFQPLLGEGRVYFRPFSFTASRINTCPQIIIEKKDTRPPTGKDNILKLRHMKIEQSFIGLTKRKSTIFHGTVQSSHPFKQFKFTTTVY